MTALYIDTDEHACAWTRNLISAGVIAPGEVWCKDIRDIQPHELQNFTQCHFFSGISVWSYALRQAGWGDSWPVWTGSCPCQSFSAAGKRAGFADERHLWPAFHWLIHQCRPETVFGEQVASKDGLAWLDLVCADLEGTGYAGWVGDLCAAGVGSPQIRQRLFFVGHSERLGARRHARGGFETQGGAFLRAVSDDARPSSATRSMAGAEGERLQRRPDDGDEGRRQRASGQGCEAGELVTACRRFDCCAYPDECDDPNECCDRARREAKTEDEWEAGELGCPVLQRREIPETDSEFRSSANAIATSGSFVRPGATNGFWRDADWIGCTDGKWRPVESEHVALAHGSSADLGRMRSDQAANEKGEVDGPSTEDSAEQILRGVRGSTGAQEVREPTRGFQPLPDEEVLRPSLHGEGNGEGDVCVSESFEDEGREVSKKEVRSLRSDGRSSSASPRREPAQQRAVKLEDALSLMSPSRALAELYGDWRTASALQALLEAINKEGPMCDAFVSPQEAWASLGEEAKNRLRVGFGHTAWVIGSSFPLVDGSAFRLGSGSAFENKSRAKMLKGYGNAVVAPLAIEFIKAAMECLP